MCILWHKLKYNPLHALVCVCVWHQVKDNTLHALMCVFVWHKLLKKTPHVCLNKCIWIAQMKEQPHMYALMCVNLSVANTNESPTATALFSSMVQISGKPFPTTSGTRNPLRPSSLT